MAAGAAPMGDSSDTKREVGKASTVLARPARAEPSLGHVLARAEVEAALFGAAAPVRLGRYQILERAGARGMGEVWSAWDPELGRGVALKLATTGDDRARSRALDEGRALAKLSHPNVVPIYDVLEHEQGVLLVMELVQGKTLKELHDERPAVREVVRVYRQAGEGLAAAHRAGLIHRDFKPSNAILGTDGRVRVVDFGLAHATTADGAGPDEIAGTPRYMAPEQRAGAAISAAADQYAFCVALREGASARGELPRWLVPVLARGSAARPGDRFPTMEALLAALALDPAARWRRRGVATLALAAVGGLGAAVLMARADAPPAPTCDGGAAIVAALWDARRPSVEAHLGGFATAYAAEAGPRLVSAIDGHARQWVDVHRGACRAHQRGEISDELLDRRAACLARSRAALATIVRLSEAVPDDGLPGLLVAAADLPSPLACEDDDALIAAVAPPAPAQRDEAAAIADLVSQVDVERDAGRLDDARTSADQVVARAQALGYRPLAARAALARGRIVQIEMHGDRGAADFAMATHAALATGDDVLAIEAYARLAWATATVSDPVKAVDGLALITAITEGAGPRATFARALLHNNLGTVALARGDRAAARASFELARDESRLVAGPGAVELTEILANLLIVTDDADARERIASELIERRTRLVGPHHPLTLMARLNAAFLIESPEAARAALAAACPELARFHPSVSFPIGDCGLELAMLDSTFDDRAGALAAAELVVASAALEPERVAPGRAYLALARGDAAGAARQFRELRARQDVGAQAPWWVVMSAADASLGAALALAPIDAGAARASLVDARALYDRIAAAVPAPVLARRRAVLDLRARERR